RKALAPTLRDRPGVAYGAVGGLLLLLVLWGPTPAFRQLAWIALFAALLALGVTVLRGQTAAEFPGVQPGEALRELRERRAAARRSGGVVVDNQRIPAQDVIDALDAIEATS